MLGTVSIRRIIKKQLIHAILIITAVFAAEGFSILAYYIDKASFIYFQAGNFVLFLGYYGEYIIKGGLAAIDRFSMKTKEIDVEIIGVIIEGYIGSKQQVVGKVYVNSGISRNKMMRKYLPFGGCAAFEHDVEFLGMPSYRKNTLYRLTYLKCSRIIVNIEQLTECGGGDVPCSISDYAKSKIKENAG